MGINIKKILKVLINETHKESAKESAKSTSNSNTVSKRYEFYIGEQILLSLINKQFHSLFPEYMSDSDVMSSYWYRKF